MQLQQEFSFFARLASSWQTIAVRSKKQISIGKQTDPACARKFSSNYKLWCLYYKPCSFSYEVQGLNGRDAIKALKISEDDFLFYRTLAIDESLKVDRDLQTACSKLCEKYTELFNLELGRLRDVELEIEFKYEATPIFLRLRPVPFAIQQDLARAYETGIARGIWRSAPFNGWEHPLSLFENHHFQVIINSD